MLFRPRRLTGEEKKQITEKHGLADACFCCGGKDGKWLCAERTHGVFHGSAARFRIAPCRISGAFIRRVRSAAARAEPENRKMPWTVFEGPSTAFHIL